MIESRPMTIDDYMNILDANAEVYPEVAILSDEHRRIVAELNVNSGASQAAYIDGRLVAIGGIRYVGLGEAWMASVPEMTESHKKSIFRWSGKTLLRMKKQHHLWRIFAESRINGNFLKHLKFEPADMYVMTGF